MAAWRIVGVWFLTLAAVHPVVAQTYSLAETAQAGDCFHIQLEMKLTGEMRVHKDGQVLPLKMEANAHHEFPERILNVTAKGMPEKVARVYEKAQAMTSVDGNRSSETLRVERRLIVAQRHPEQLLVYSPAGPLSRDELALTAEHFDTLALTGLLPAQKVAVGDTWKVANLVVQSLCNFEGLTNQDLVCKLEEVKDKVARVSVKGTATGIDLGALVKLTIDATYQFDLQSQRLTQLEWRQQDDRNQGPVNPASKVEATTKLTRKAIDEPPVLSNVALVSVPEGFDVPAPLQQIEHKDAKGRFQILYPRDWQTVSQTDEHVVMRLMERGDFVAQVTITPWTAAGKGQHLSAEQFESAMAETPGWEVQQVREAGEINTEGGRWVYRISAQGKLDGIDVVQNFFLVVAPSGEQVVLAFTMTPKQAQRLGARDLALTGAIDFAKSK
jgi:hypothetical protein